MSEDSRWATTRLRALTIGVLLFAGFACARSDWIEATLVTANVTGVWSGSCKNSGAGGANAIIELTLAQNGPKVTGRGRAQPGTTWPLEGAVNGDVFRFSGSMGVAGEFQVDGDEMSGPASIWWKVSCQLRRQP